MSDVRSPVVVVAARRTPFGAVHGLLSGWHPADLLSHTLAITLDDAGIPAADIDTALVGCAHPVGAQALNVGRAAVLGAGWPDHIPATTIERGSGSSHRALHLASHTIAAGAADLVVVAGVEVMSLVPAGAPGLNRQYGPIWGSGPAQRYASAGGLIPAGVAGDRLAEQLAIGRAELDSLAAACRTRARDQEHPPWLVVTPTRLNDRELPRAALTVMVNDEVPTRSPVEDGAPLHDEAGTVAASNVAPDADGAAVVVLASAQWATDHQCVAQAAIGATADVAADPVGMFDAAPRAARTAIEAAGLAADDLVAVELDGPHALAIRHAADELGLDPAAVNVGGGSLGRGRPLGAVGTAMVADLIGRSQHGADGPRLLVDQSDDGTATATVLVPHRDEQPPG